MLNPLTDKFRFAPDATETASVTRVSRAGDAHARATPSAILPQVLQDGCLLLIGDALALSEAIATRLHHSGFRVVRVTGKDEALTLLVAQTPALIVMESALAEGTTFVHTLRQRRRAARVPVILVTALLEEDETERLYAADPNVLLIEHADQTHLERSIIAILFAGDNMKRWLQTTSGPRVPSTLSRMIRFEDKGSAMPRGPPGDRAL